MLDDVPLPSPLNADCPDDTAARSRPRPDVVLRFLAEDVADGAWYAGLDFLRVDDQRAQEIVPRAMLNNASALADELAKRGCRLPPDRQGQLALARKLAASEPDRHPRLTCTTGYFDRFRVYVFEDAILGERAGGWIFRPRTRAVVAQTGGSLGEWIRLIAKPALHSPYLMFAVAVAFASLTPGLAGVESGGFHLHAKPADKNDPRSSIGKTICLLGSASVLGPATRQSLPSWNATDTGFEELAAACNDRAVFLDELAQASDEPREIAKRARRLAFMIAGQHGRVRAAAYDQGRGRAVWRTLLLSTGELGIAELVADARLKGEEVRVHDVPIEADPELGIFRSLPKKYATSGELVDKLEERCARHFGHPARAFVARLLEDPGRWLRFVRERMAYFHEKAGVPDAGWERRFAKRFALTYAGACLAIEFGILPWTRRQAFDAIALCYRAARGAIPDTEAQNARALARLRQVLGGKGKLADLRPSAGKRPRTEQLKAAAGFLKSDPKAGDYVAVRREVFEAAVAPLPVALVLERLQRDGQLLTTPGRRGLWRQVLVKRLGAKKLACACISAAFVTG